MAIALASIVTVQQDLATSVTVSYPSGVQAGDLMLVVVTHSSNVAPTGSIPSGWTEYTNTIGGSSSQGPSTVVYYRVAQGGESGGITFPGHSTAGRITGHISRWTGVDTTTPFDFDPVKGPREFTLETTTPAVTTTVNDVELIYSVAISSTSTSDINTAAGTTRFAWTTGTGRRSSLFREARPTAGATSTKTWTQTGTVALNWGTVVIGLRPAGSTPPPPSSPVHKGTAVVAEATSSTSISMSYPSGIAAGELLTAHITCYGANAPTVNPGGWVQLAARNAANLNSNEPASTIWYKFATGSESGSVTFQTNGVANRVTGSMHRWGGVDGTTPIDVVPSTAAHSGEQSYITVPPITPTVDGALLAYHIVLDAVSSADIVTPAGVTKHSGTTGISMRQSVYSEVLATASLPSTERSFAMSPTSVRAMHGILFALRPGSSGGGGDGTGGGGTTDPGGGTTDPGGDPGTGPVGPQPGTPPTLTQRNVGVPADPTTNGVVQVKTSGAVSCRLRVSLDAAGTSGVRYGPSSAPSSLGDARLTISGLSAHTRYYYRVMMTNSSGGEFPDSLSQVGRLRTAPVGPKSFAFVFGSCDTNGDPVPYQAMFDRGAPSDPSADVGDAFFCMIGDYYYADGTGSGIDNFRSRMGGRMRGTRHQLLHSTMGSVYVPSDHDGMNNNTVGGNDPTAWNNWATVVGELWPQPALYYTFVWGRVRFIAINTRVYKTATSATDNSSKTALGTTQKTWFKQQITNATEPVICIIQDGPWIGSADSGDDSWFGYITERTELANHMQASGKNIFMLAGDMHALAADDGRNSPGGIAVFHAAPLYTTSSTKGGPYSAGVYPSSGVSGTSQYGRVVITDTGGTSITVKFEGYDSGNTQRLTLTKTYSAPLAGFVTVAAPKAVTSGDFPAPEVTVTASPVGVGATRATASARAFPPTLVTSLTGSVVAPRGIVNTTAVPAHVTVGQSIAVEGPARATASARPPELVEGIVNGQVIVPSTAVTVGAVAPVVRGFFQGGADVPFAGATVTALTPTVLGQVSASVSVPVAVVGAQTGTGHFVEALIAGTLNVPVATATIRANGILLGAGLLITVTYATATTRVLADDIQVSAGWNAMAVAATATAGAVAPSVSVGSTVTPPAATVSAAAKNPAIGAGITFLLDPTGPVSVQAHPAVIQGTVIIAAPRASVGVAAFGGDYTFGANVEPTRALAVARAFEPFVQATNAVEIAVPLSIVLGAARAVGIATNMPIAPVARINVTPGGPIVTTSSLLTVPVARVFVDGGNATGAVSAEIEVGVGHVAARAFSDISYSGDAVVEFPVAKVVIKAGLPILPGNESWLVRWPSGINRDAYSPELIALAEQAAMDTMRMLTLYRVGGLPITVMPCSNTCVRPYSGGQFGNSYVPFYPILLESGAYANCFCTSGCGCENVSTVLLTEPVGRIAVVKINGEVVDPTLYHVDDGNKLVRHDGIGWPSCAGENFTVTYLNAYEVDEYGSFVAGILAMEFLKLFTTPKECRLPRTVTDVTRGGMTFTVSTQMFPDGMTGINEVDSYLVRWNPNGLRSMPMVISPDVPSQHQTTWRA